MREFEDDAGFDGDFDAFLHAALAERPEPTATPDLACRVLTAAGTPRAVSAWPTWAAAAAIAAIVFVGVMRFLALGDSTSTTNAVATAVSTDSVALLPIGGFLFVAALAWTIARPVFQPAESPLVASVG